MGSYSGIARGDLRNCGAGDIRFTGQGVAELEELVKCGSTVQDIADYFCMTVGWVERQVGPGGAQEELYRFCSAYFKKSVRSAQIKLMNENASMAKFIGANVLSQSNQPKIPEDGLDNKVIGTLPTWTGSPDDWLKKHKPSGTGGSTIDKIRAMRDKNKAEDVAEDAEQIAGDGEGGDADQITPAPLSPACTIINSTDHEEIA